MIICKGCNNPTEFLMPSPMGLQNADGTGEIITEICDSCLKSVLNVMKETGLGSQSNHSEKMEGIQTLINKIVELGMELPAGTPISVESLKKLIAEHE